MQQLEADRAALELVDSRLDTLNETLASFRDLLASTPVILADQIRQFDTLRLSGPAADALDCPPQTQMACDSGQSQFPEVALDPAQQVSQVSLPSPPRIDLSQVARIDAQSDLASPQPGPSAESRRSAIGTPSAAAAALADSNACQAVTGSPASGAPVAIAAVEASPAAASAMDEQQPLGTASTGSDGVNLADYLAALPEDDRALLAATELSSPEDVEKYDLLVESIVNEQIVAPHFLSLNREKDALLSTSFATAKQGLCAALGDGEASLDRFGISATTILDPVNAVEADLRRYPIEPPADPPWWRTYHGKGVTSAAIDADVDAIARQLDIVDDRLTEPEREILALVAGVRAQQDRVTAALAEVNAQFDEARATFQDYARPLPVIPIDLKNAVLYFPVLLAVAIGVFVVRFRDLRERRRQLWNTGDLYGLAPQVALAYLGDVPRDAAGIQDDARPGKQTTIGLIVLAILAPVLFALTTRVVVSSAVYTADPRWFPLLYAGATLLVVGAYAALLRDRRGSRPHPTEE